MKGLKEVQLLKKLEAVNLGTLILEDCSEHDDDDDDDDDDHKVIEVDEKSINFWLKDGVLDEIQWSPFFIDDDTINWPK